MTKEKTNGSDSGNNADDSLQITAPQTGDNSHPMLWVTLLAASLAGLLALLSVRRKKMRNNHAALRLTAYNFIKGITGLCSVIPFKMEAFQ